MNQPPLIVIVGPTASGKSDLAMQIAHAFNGELICADSRTVYKGLDIGTAKPSAADQQAVPHHLIDLVEPNQRFTAADFKQHALDAIADISRRGKMPIMVGGTGLYVDAVLFDYQFGEPADSKIRDRLLKMTVEQLQQECRDLRIDMPINMQNKRHLIRTLERGGSVRPEWHLRPNTIVVGISTEREVLRARITKRAQAMVQDGIVDEVRALGQKYGWNIEAMTANIYRIFKDVVNGNRTLQEAIGLFIQSDMALAKRQMTWFKRNPHILWGTPQELNQRLEHFMSVVKR